MMVLEPEPGLDVNKQRDRSSGFAIPIYHDNRTSTKLDEITTITGYARNAFISGMQATFSTILVPMWVGP